MTKPQLGVFGGTFDPPHFGHLIAAQSAWEQLELERVLWVPTGESYHKNTNLSPVNTRLELTRLAIARNPAFEISEVDAVRPGPTYSFDTVAALAAEHPNHELVLVIGEDSFETMSSWHRSAELLQRVQVAVVRRDNQGSRRQRDTSSVRWVEIPPIPFTSSEIRNRVRLGLSIRYFTPDAVLDYIKYQHLYMEVT